MNLYSYCIPYDDGAAPNPYWGTCTLVICKPAIRRTAEVGDWVVGTGARFARLSGGRTTDLSGHVVYAMKVTKKLTLKAYDDYAKASLKRKLPAWRSADRRRRVGDALYDFSTNPPKQRKGVHRPNNRETDLSGKNALLSTHFYYFGDQAVPLPRRLRPIAQNRQGHRRALNEPFKDDFVTWIEGLGHKPGTILGEPALDLFADDTSCRWCAGGRAEEAEMDEELYEPGC